MPLTLAAAQEAPGLRPRRRRHRQSALHGRIALSGAPAAAGQQYLVTSPFFIVVVCHVSDQVWPKKNALPYMSLKREVWAALNIQRRVHLYLRDYMCIYRMSADTGSGVCTAEVDRFKVNNFTCSWRAWGVPHVALLTLPARSCVQLLKPVGSAAPGPRLWCTRETQLCAMIAEIWGRWVGSRASSSRRRVSSRTGCPSSCIAQQRICQGTVLSKQLNCLALATSDQKCKNIC